MKNDKSRTNWNKKRRKKLTAGFAGVAVLALAVILGMTYFSDGGIITAGDKQQLSAEVNSLSDSAVKHKEVPDQTMKDENQTDETSQSDQQKEESEEENTPDANESDKNESDKSQDEQEGNGHNEQENKGESDRNDNQDKDNEKQPEDIQQVSNTIIEALNTRDMQTVAGYVHPEKGLLFSPYVYVTDDAVTFDKDEVSSMLERDETFNWGNYDGKGNPIELTPAEYADEFLDMSPYLNPDEVLVDDMQQRGNTKNNIKEVFPNATVIEYYNEGPEEYEGIDWKSLDLVYEKNEAGELQLVAIVRDMRTV